ncbi:MAG TPA: hypothetical protein VM686_12415, partial [Polyangiaceae bacterium]|nr:hypothetical protein [Polyangiaceae bacterium]
MSRVLLSIATLTFLACEGTTATPPDDASAAAHERAAKQAERNSWGYETAQAQAAGPHGSQPDSPNTFDNRRAAIDQRQKAAEQRAVAQGLRAAEKELCAPVPEGQTDPLLRRDDVTFVSMIEERGVSVVGPGETLKTVGVRLRLQAAPGTTTESLQQLLDCHIARARVAGTVAELDGGSPLTLDSVVAKVDWMPDGFAVNVTSDDSDAAREIVRWAQA